MFSRSGRSTTNQFIQFRQLTMPYKSPDKPWIDPDLDVENPVIATYKKIEEWKK